jgi:hypothetical protein
MNAVMAQVDGLEATKHIRSIVHFRELPIIALGAGFTDCVTNAES